MPTPSSAASPSPEAAPAPTLDDSAPLPPEPSSSSTPHSTYSLEYGHEPGRGHMPVSLHATLVIYAMAAGWVGGPLLAWRVVLPRLGELAGACLMLPLLLGSAIAFALIPAWLLKRFLPARCPACGGRADYRSLNPPRYRCRDCARVHGM
jgi:hypothetical protein